MRTGVFLTGASQAIRSCESVGKWGLLLLAALPWLVEAATFTPTTFSDLPIASLADVNASGQIASQGNAITLRSAVIASNVANASGGSSTITLNAGTYVLSIPGTGETAAAGNALIGDLDVLTPATAGQMSTLTVQGAGAANTTIQQTTGIDRIFDVHPVNVPGSNTFILTDVTVTGGKITSQSGGALLAGRPGDVTTLSNCVFDGNVSPNNAGAVTASGGAAVHTLNITNCVFRNNVATNGTAGAVNYSGNGTVNISNTLFINNTSGAAGAAVNVSGPSGTFNISRSAFINNTSNTVPGNSAFGGAAISIVQGASLNVHFNRFFGNVDTAAFPTGRLIAITGGTVTTFDVNTNWWGVNTGPGASDILGTAPTNWLQLRNSASPTTISAGATSTVTADIFGLNTGGSTAPSNLVGLPAFPTAGSAFGNAQKGTIPGAVVQFVGGVAAVVFTGTTAGSGGVDAVADGQTVTAPITVTATPDLTISKTSSGAFVQGGSGFFTLTVNNTGSAATTAAYTVTDSMPSGLTISSVAPQGTGWNCAASTSTAVNCTRSTAIPASGAAPAIVVNVTIAANAPASITNTANVSGGGESNTGNNSGSVTAPIAASTAPVITTNPANATVAAAATASFTAAATGNPTPTLQWQVSTNNGASFTNIGGATVSPLSFSVQIADNNKQYRAVFTNVAGPATSTAATLTVTNGAVLNIDSSDAASTYDPATDGLLLIRYLFGLRGASLIANARGGGASLRDATQIETHIAANLPLLDVDGDGQVMALTDGLMILRRLLSPASSPTDATASAAITANAKRTTRTNADVVRAIDSLKP